MRVALIHATPAAMDPVNTAFLRHWPQAEQVHLLDDSLSRDRASAGALTAALSARIRAMADYAIGLDAKAILYTCSAFGPAIRAVAQDLSVPVLTPNEAMFQEVAAIDGRAGLLASFPPSIDSMAQEFADLGPRHPLATACASGAMDALSRSDVVHHDTLLAETAVRALSDCSVIMLAQFSTARARDAVARATDRPVMTSPDSAVRHLRSCLEG